MPITPLFASIFAIIFVFLSMRVALRRRRQRISVGSGGDMELELAIRAHANFIEYVPISLILMWFLEVIAHASGLVLILGTALLLARLAHIVGILDTENKLIFRSVGMLVTFAVILISSMILIWHYFPVMV